MIHYLRGNVSLANSLNASNMIQYLRGMHHSPIEKGTPMPYPPRAQSASDVYHVITWGAGQLAIFEDDQDRGRFMKILLERAEALGIGIWAWCLMGNHVHLLVQGPLKKVSNLLQGAKSQYARYFNKRHVREGSLFRGRYTSVPIQTDEQLVTTVKYIHLNPVEAGEGLESRWSSYVDYFDRKDVAPEGKKILGDLMGGPSGFAKSHENAGGEKPKLPRRRIGEDEALQLAQAVLAPLGLDVRSIGALDKAERDAHLARLKAAGLSVRQISRFTSIGQNIVARA